MFSLLSNFSFGFLSGSIESAVVGELEAVGIILVVFEKLQESCLATRQLSEFDGNSILVSLENTDTHINIVLNLVLEVVSSSLGKLDLVLIFAYLELCFVLGQVLDEGLFNHIGIICREELGRIFVYLLILLQVLLWFIKIIILVECGRLLLSHNLLGHASIDHSSLSLIHPHLFLLSLLHSLSFECL